MLYDPRWETEVETKADPLSLAAFIEWLETKPPRQKYTFEECRGLCLLGQYMATNDIPWTGAPSSPNAPWDGSSYLMVARKIFGPGRFKVLSDSPHTFGAALKRARAAQRSDND